MISENMAQMSFGERVKKLRKDRNWTQGELGERAQVNGHNVSRYENGHLQPSKRTAEKFAQALGVSPEELLFTGIPTEQPSLAIEDAELLHLFREVADLPESDRIAIKRILAIVVKQNRLQQMIAS